MPSIVAISFSASVEPPVFFSARTTACAAMKPPQVKKSGGSPLKRFLFSATSQSFTGFFGMS